MSLVSTLIRCMNCQHEYAGMWDLDSKIQPLSSRCPKCGGAATQRANTVAGAAFDSGNLFEVCAQGDWIIFNRPIMGRVAKKDALNWAAWVAALSDPDGREFLRVYNDIKGH